MTQSLKSKVALITGASRGIGRSIALQLASLGADIAVNYVRNDEAATECLSALKKHNVKSRAFKANVGDSKEIDKLVADVENELGPIDILVHNAAIGAFKPIHTLKPNQWDLSMQINTHALLGLTQKVLPMMEKRKSGSIIALSSLGAQKALPNYGAIGVSKAALEALIRYLAAELAPKGIRVNGVSGGLVDTDALTFYPNADAMKKKVIGDTPAGRIGRPEDMAKVVAFLASEESSWIYGQVLVADGGLSLR